MTLLIRASRFAISPLPVPASWYAIPLRLIAGFGFLQHGYAKLARGPDDFAGVLLAIGVPAPELLGWATIIVEIVGGLFVLLGAFVPLATIPMAVVLLVAIVTVHLPNGFSSIKLQSFDAAGAHFGQPGYETDLLYLAILIALCLGGPGPLSVDGYLGRFRSMSSGSDSGCRHGSDLLNANLLLAGNRMIGNRARGCVLPPRWKRGGPDEIRDDDDDGPGRRRGRLRWFR